MEASEKHCLELLDLVADLMEVPRGKMEYTWGSLYMTYMSECTGLEVGATSAAFRSYAEVCYEELCEILTERGVGEVSGDR